MKTRGPTPGEAIAPANISPVLPARPSDSFDEHLWTELSRTNNELVDLQRGMVRKNAELAAAQTRMRASEQRYLNLSACSPNGILEMDPAGRCLYSNPHWQTDTGLSAAQSLGEGWQQALDSRDARDFLDQWTAARDGVEECSRQIRLVTTAGDQRWVQFCSRSIRGPGGGITGHVCTLLDITDFKRADSRVQLQSAALEAAANAIVITDSCGAIQWANNAFTALTGYTVQEAIGKNPRILKSGKQDKAFYANLWATILAGNVWHGEIINRRKDGANYTEEMTITPVRDMRGQIANFIAVKGDITPRKLLEAELVDVSRRAGMAEVATGVLHNVGNVLNSVNVSANLLVDQVRTAPVADLLRVIALLRERQGCAADFFANDSRGPKVLNFLDKLAATFADLQTAQFQEVAALQKNIDHIKDIVAMQQSYATVSGLSETLQVPDLLEDMLRMNIGAFTRHRVRVVRDFAPDLPAIVTGKHKVLQILVNLMSNARAACRDSPHADKQVTLRVTHSGDRVRIAVIDNGIGIPAENLNRIFTHGFTTKKDGHGFGLHNSANAAKELGGRLTAHSPGPGLGATFTLDLPVNRPAEAI